MRKQDRAISDTQPMAEQHLNIELLLRLQCYLLDLVANWLFQKCILTVGLCKTTVVSMSGLGCQAFVRARTQCSLPSRAGLEFGSTVARKGYTNFSRHTGLCLGLDVVE